MERHIEYLTVQCVLCHLLPYPAAAWSFPAIVNAQGLCGHCSQLVTCSYSKKLSFSVGGDMQSAVEDGSPWAEDWDSVQGPSYIMIAQ